MKQLTPEQQDLVVQNMGIIDAVIRKQFKPYIGNEDVYQIASYGLCIAARDFDPSCDYGFPKFAWYNIYNRIVNYFRSTMTMSRRDEEPPLSLDYKCGTENEGFNLYNTLVSNTIDPLERIVNKTFLEEVIDFISPEYRKVILYLAWGYEYKEIGSQLGKAPKHADNVMHKIKHRIDKLYPNHVNWRRGPNAKVCNI